MQVKVDFSTDCKQHNYDTSRPGTYAIYTRKHWWQSWKEVRTHADLEWCKREAKRISELPIYYRLL